MNETLAIPDDRSAREALIRELERTVEENDAKIRKNQETIQGLQEKIAELELTVNELLQKAFRQRSERYLEDPQQLKLDFDNTDEAADAATGLAEAVDEAGLKPAEIVVPEHTRRKRVPKVRNEQLPAHLPRYEVTADVPPEVSTCPEHGPRQVIGHDRVETLEFERPKLKVRVTLYPKHACEHSATCGIAQPPRPKGLVEGNRYDTSIAAEIITGKFGYHLPIYRQQDWFAGSGWLPGRSTLLNILSAAADLLKPLIASFRQQVLDSGLLGTDETRVTLLLPSEIPAPVAGDLKSQRIHEVFTQARNEDRPSVSGRMWAYRSLVVPLNVFDFTVSRHRDGPDAFLVEGRFTGTMMGDCYSGFQGLSLRSDARIIRAACVAHARRKVFDARDNHPLLSSQFLALFRELYDVEDRAKSLSASGRQALRQHDARPVWQRMRELLDGEAASRLLPKDKFAEALGYLRNQWDALQVYLSDGRLPIDNNEVEQLMKQVAIGRKNWLFIGSVSAGERAADLLTLVSSAVRNDLDVWAYVKDVLDQLLLGSQDYLSLRPDVWGADHPGFIRTYRQEERRDRADAKSGRREQRRRNHAR
jgi:transposase